MKNLHLFTEEVILLGDSPQVLEEYYQEKIVQLEDALNRLNVQEHAIKIQVICKKIIFLKSSLQLLKMKRIKAA